MEYNFKSTIIIFIVGVFIGLGISFVFLGSSEKSDSGNTYQAGFDAAKKLVQESSFAPMMMSPSDIRNFFGKVTAVNGKSISVAGQASADPFEDKSLNDKIVKITADTKIFVITPKSAGAIKIEMDAFMKSMSTAKDVPPTPPTMFTRTASDASSIKIGSTISVTAGENIKSIKEFSAVEIQVETTL